MTRITISAESLEDLEKLKQVISWHCKIVKVKGPKRTAEGRVKCYIFIITNS